MKTIIVKDILKKFSRNGSIDKRQIVPALFFLGAMFLLGRAAVRTYAQISQADGHAVSETLRETENWGLGFGKEGQKPQGNVTAEALEEYNAYFVAKGEDKVIYLTFDCGFENGNTQPILDALKKHDAPATFFVVGHYLESAPDLVKRMVEDA